ncbi:Protein lifeguard 1 [Oryzias melastigma]|uniref:Prion protein b n=1 Tax=Oryzias melastigma TaxID=30732 RepID=A0A3B3B7F7_ORYME|nr:prisilkin-39 [Oryzias melastigma]KAF6716520.1 Protein lifeguard 1 [Oryzias melastigma]
MMGRLCQIGLLSLLIISLLNTEPAWGKRGGSSKKPSLSSNKGGTHSKPSSSQPANYPRQPQNPARNPNPYPAGGSYPHPGTGNSNPGGYPRQNPPNYPNQNPGGYPAGSYPGAGGRGSYPNQNPGYPAGGYPAGGYPAGGYPAGGNPAGGYPAGGYPAGGYPAGGYPAGGNPARGYPAGGYPAGGSYPNQGRPGYPNQYPAGGGFPNQNPGRNYPNQYPGAGYPVGGGYSNQYPGGGGMHPGGYPNWSPNNNVFNSRFGGGGYGHGGYGMGGSPFSRTVQGMGIQPKSTGFAKKAMMAAGVGALAGMAVGYGLGRFPRPHFNFRSPEEEYYYNNYMYRRYGKESTDEKDYGRDYVYKIPPRAETYENFMARCMNETDKDQASRSPAPVSGANAEEDDTVSIEEIGYPALIEQMKSRRCVEKYMIYSEKFLESRSEQQSQSGRSSALSCGLCELLTSCFMLLSSMLLLQ